jgi:signal transduction histidine kinase/DNA-binding response OmpR family regulator
VTAVAPRRSRSRLGTRIGAYLLGLVAIAIVLPASLDVVVHQRELREHAIADATATAELAALTSTDEICSEDFDRLRAFAATFSHDRPDVLSACFVSHDGTIVAHSRPELEGGHLADLVRPPSAIGVEVRDDRIVVTAPIRVSGEPFASFRLESSLASVHAAMRRSLLQDAASGIVLLALGAWASRRLARWIARPVVQLAAAAAAVARGDLETRSGVVRDDEVGELAASFDEMTEELAAKNLSLVEQTELLELRVAERTSDLEKARDDALQAARIKSEFLANMSHEIRTPMNGVLGFVDLLGETELTPRQREYLDTVRGSGETLLAILNDVLDFSKIEAGRVELEQVEFGAREFFESVADLLAPRAQDKKLEFVCSVAPSVPQRLVGDPTRLRQVLLNLLGNAVKFTERGEVALEASAEPAGDGAARLQVVVRDSGIGIPKERQADLFQAFVQADGSTTRRFGGTGLGLAISRRLVELMGGTLEVESVEGEGSRFTVVLTLATAGVVPRDGGDDLLRGVSVLVVDDHPTNRRLLHEVLTSAGAHVVLASSGVEALATMREAARHCAPFRLALLDMQMPGLDGLGVVDQMRADPVFATTVPILLTSMRFASTARALERGVAAVLTKPIKRGALLDAMRAVLAPRAEPESAAAASPTGALDGVGAGVRVLLAEDHLVNQRLVQTMLSKCGASVELAADGRQAVDRWARGGLDLVLMDVQMPEMDGESATREIRRREAADPARGRTPIVALTAHAMTGDRERYLAAGMDDYVTKPVRAAELARVVSRWAKKGSERTAESPKTDFENNPMDPTSGTSNAYPEVVERLREIGLLDDPALVAETIGLFLQDADAVLDTLQSSFASGDSASLERAAHRLKGAALNLGVTSLATPARVIEEQSKRANFSGIPEPLATLGRELVTVRAFLTSLAKQLLASS